MIKNSIFLLVITICSRYFASVPLPISFFAKKELFFIPLFGWAMITSGMIPVNRNNKNKSKKSVDRGN